MISLGGGVGSASGGDILGTLLVLVVVLSVTVVDTGGLVVASIVVGDGRRGGESFAFF